MASPLTAQVTLEDLVNKLPYSSAKEGELIYLLQFPEWEKTFPSQEIGVDFRITVDDAPDANRVAFGNMNYGKKNGYFRFFNTGEMSFSEKYTSKSVSLEGFKETAYERFYVKGEDPGNADNAIIRTVQFTEDDVELDHMTSTALLEQVEKRSASITSLSWFLTQDRRHILLDYMIEENKLEGKVTERHWSIVEVKDKQVIHDVTLPYSNPAEGRYVSLEPYGLNDMPPVFVGQDGKNYNQGYSRIGQIEPGQVTLSSPGTNLVFVRFRNQGFWQNRSAVAAVDMKTGEILYIAPPRKDMELPGKEFINPNYAAPIEEELWLTRNSKNENDYEVLFHYNDKDSTYITVGSFLLGENSGVQLVFQNTSGEYFDRLPMPNYRENIPVQHYRIRKLNSNEVLGDYTLLSSSPLRITNNGKYLVFMEGTPRNTVITLRDKLTGKLIDSAPGGPASQIPYLVESANGVLIYSYRNQRLMFSLLAFPDSTL